MSKPNRLFYTLKFTSSFLKEYKYNTNKTFEECLGSNLVISLSDSQMLKTIRDITNHTIDRDLLESYYTERDRIKKSKHPNYARIKELQKLIYDMMYIPEYITIQMDSLSDYKRLFTKGFIFNGRTYRRASCSASQARVSTIVFVSTDIRDELLCRLNNGRDLSHPLAASKFNAYMGLYSSASKPVTEPRFCIVPDFNSSKEVTVDWSIETDWDKDDIIEPRTLSLDFNRWDGMGLISPAMATQWAQDLDLDYIPSQFCIRYSFTKGLVDVFDFHLWCHDEPSEPTYTITDIYGSTIDLREIDVILTEGMAKLWDSWSSQSSLISNSHANGIDWRVTKYAPKQDKEASTLNYQYIQALNIPESEIPSLCKDTVDYLKGVTIDDPYYSLLFMMGQESTPDSLQNFLQSSDNYWLKSCILDHDLLKDKYAQAKLRDQVSKRISQACLGRLLARGNYQAIVADPYGLMEWVVYRDPSKVHGLLNDREFYSKFWADRDKENIICMRSPLTSMAEPQVYKNIYKEEQFNE